MSELMLVACSLDEHSIVEKNWDKKIFELNRKAWKHGFNHHITCYLTIKKSQQSRHVKLGPSPST